MWPFVPPDMKGLRELNICETKNCEIKVCEPHIENWKSCGKIANEQIFIAFICLWTLFYSGIKSHKIDHTFKTHD